MLKQTIKYEDLDGNMLEEDFYFNLKKSELLEMQMSAEGGLQKKIQRIIEAKDIKSIVEMFKDIILLSIGKKSDDGKSFIKTPEITKAFEQSEAFDELYLHMLEDEKFAADFVNGIIPAKLREEALKEQKKQLEALETKE